MRIYIDIEYSPSEDEAPTCINLGPDRMRKDFSIKRVNGNLVIRIKPQIHENEEAFVALIHGLYNSDEIMICLGQLVEAAFLTGVEIGKSQK